MLLYSTIYFEQFSIIILIFRTLFRPFFEALSKTSELILIVHFRSGRVIGNWRFFFFNFKCRKKEIKRGSFFSPLNKGKFSSYWTHISKPIFTLMWKKIERNMLSIYIENRSSWNHEFAQIVFKKSSYFGINLKSLKIYY